MNRELLEKPFDPNQIKQREGNFGKMLDYIEGHAVINRLNDAFDANWSFAILKHEIVKETDEVVVIGELSAGDIVKTQFGSSRITRARETGEMISLADDLKAAATDAIKKCASLMGVGLHLYNKDGHPSKRQPISNDNRSAGSNGNRKYGRNNGYRGGNGDNGGNGSRSDKGQANGRLSSKQHKYILDLIKEKGMTKSELNQQCVQAYGSVLAHISRHDASSLIDELMAQ
jgi:Rad52/22 family double-strand break repair protein